MLFCSVTYTTYPAAQLPYKPDTCATYDGLYGTICTPTESYDPQNPPTPDAYIGSFSWDEGWRCKGWDNDEDKRNGGDGLAFALIINLVATLGWLIPMIVICCYCRNKSQNTAPFNGE